MLKSSEANILEVEDTKGQAVGQRLEKSQSLHSLMWATLSWAFAVEGNDRNEKKAKPQTETLRILGLLFFSNDQNPLTCPYSGLKNFPGNLRGKILFSVHTVGSAF